MSRCIAIAAHGKRCQQSPFRGGPYCWHHTQSRKIPAPSRPLGSSGGLPGAAPRARTTTAEASFPERRAGAERRADDALAGRIVAALGRERAEELAAFLEAPDAGAFLLLKDEHGLVTESTPPVAREHRTA